MLDWRNNGSFKGQMYNEAKYTIDILAGRKFKNGLTAKEAEQMTRAKNLKEDVPEWYDMSPEDANEVFERWLKMKEVNKELGIEA